MIIQEIAQYLEDNGIGTEGSDIFIGELPLDKTNCISLVYSPSPEQDTALHYYTQMIDVWARFTNFEDGYNKLIEVMRLLHRKENYETENFHIYISYSLGMPVDNGRDIERNHLFQIPIAFIYRELVEMS